MAYPTPAGPAGPYGQAGHGTWHAGDPRTGAAPGAGPAAPRKGLVILVGVLLTAAVLSVMAFFILWVHHTGESVGSVTKDDVKDLPGPRSLGVLPGAIVIPGGLGGGGA